MINTKTKLFPNNSHMNHYLGWHFLGNDGKADYYVGPRQLHNNELWADFPLLSIVFSNEPSDYCSPYYEGLFSDAHYPQRHPIYKTLYDLLLENGYHATGRTVSSKDTNDGK